MLLRRQVNMMTHIGRPFLLNDMTGRGCPSTGRGRSLGLHEHMIGTT